MIPPPGYVALGYCYTSTPNQPKKEDYWCVKEEYVVGIGSRKLFSDSGTGWSYHDMDVYEGALLSGQTARPGRELCIPKVGKGVAGPLTFYALDFPQGLWPQPDSMSSY